ncbi:outer membrane protein OmpA-like peptidoglycan-associated protein [Lewinella marina]|uniref:Flagellar motor protein MotB n=1 Tax=Neolewinella marina TaxID=438751 RepID=A0A2G0CIB9_9BACT|nr:OmpA family protein [Neolewinella marina]NJB85142.1 outer membrane protein OmpA-like peptidoglycan-associated protein [Neolewinella marina]PHK99723.1 flagellar motor protein MotB [Neolewinella marina]
MYRILLIAFVLIFAGGCTYTAKITDGATAVERKQYDVAVPMLQREYKRAKSRGQQGAIAMNLAISYRETGRDEPAVEWFQTAYDNGVGPDALREKAAALKRLERYEEAIQTYTDLGFEIGSRYEFRKDIAGAELAMRLKAEREAQKVPEYEVTPVAFNSAGADYAAVALNDQLVFTSDRSAATGEETYKWTGRSFSDIFTTDDPTSGAVSPFNPSVNTEYNEGTPAFSPDGNTMYFTRCSPPAKRSDAYCGIYRSERTGGGWSPAEKLPFVTPDANFMHPAVSADGTRLIFSANLNEGWGGYDLYTVDRLPDGNWSQPDLMNRAINTDGNEQFPTLDGDTLYFSSDGLEGLGGLDIFRTWPMEDGRYAAPRNLKMPINSGADDFAYIIVQRNGTGVGSTTTGYFSSSRPGGAGSDDIYAYTKTVLPPPPPSPDPVVYRNVLDVTVVEKIYEEPGNPRSRVLGLRPVPNATVIASIGDQSRTVSTNEEGQLSLVLADDQLYQFRAERPDYLSDEGRFSSRNLPRDPEAPEQRYELELEIEKIFRNQEIVLENIYYDFDESSIRQDAQPTLNELAEVLTLNPDIRIELGSHTDCRGRDAYNQTLSQARAQAAVDYLISKGISTDRLAARGYGESQPIAECVCERCTEDQHQLNRRTTFRILE